MYEYLTQPGNLMNIIIGVMALIFGASAHTVRSLKSRNVTVKVSILEWLHNQATALPVGLITLFVAPSRFPDIKGPELLALMLIIGIFSTEAWSLLRLKIFQNQSPSLKGEEEIPDKKTHDVKKE